MVKPDLLNPVSNDQICVRGRFHYDALKPRERLTRHLVRTDDSLTPSTLQMAVDAAAAKLAGVIKNHGADSVGLISVSLFVYEAARHQIVEDHFQREG